jgi:hypothetical protein
MLRNAAVALALLGTVGTAGAQAIAVDAEIVLAVDASVSVAGNELVVQRGGYLRALRHPALARAVAAGRHGRIALSYFEWSGRVWPGHEVPWTIISTADDAAAFADAVAALPVQPRYGTSISRALAHGAASIRGNQITSARRVIDVSGDGPNNLGPPVQTARDAVVAAGITVNGLPILLDPPRTVPAIDRYYADCVIGGIGAFLMPVRAPDELAPAILRKLVLEISGLPVAARLIPAAAEAPVECLAGERARRDGAEPYFPGLYK